MDANTADEAALQGRRLGRRHRRARARAAVPDHRASSDFGNSTSIGGATLAIFDLADRAGALPQGRASSTRSTSPPSRMSRTQAARSPRSRRSCRPTRRSRPARRRRKQSSDQITSALSILAVLPARLRRHRPLRRRVRDREHALDHDRPADARVRDPARRSGATARQVRRVVILEGLVTGALRLDRRALRRPGARQGAERALQGGRGRPAADRARVRDRARSSSRSASGSIVTLLASLWPALRATRVPPIAAVREGSVLAALAVRALRAGRRASSSAPSRSRSSCFGAFGRGLTTGRACSCSASACSASSSASPWSRPSLARPLASVLGWPATRIGGVAGTARALERDAQPGPHRLDRGRADDRARARHRRRGARGRAAQRRSSARSRASSTPTTCSPRRTASRRPSVSSADALRQRPRRHRRRRRPRRRRPRLRVDDPGRRARAGALAGADARLEGRARTPRWRRSAPRARSSTARFAKLPPPHRRLADHGSRRPPASSPTSTCARSSSPRRVERPARRRLDLLGAFDSLYPNPENVYTLIAIAGRRHRRANTARLNAVLAQLPRREDPDRAAVHQHPGAGPEHAARRCSTSCSGSRSSSASSGS